MKLRIQGNALRLRLNRREVSHFERNGRVAAALVFPGGRTLSYALLKGGAELDAAFDDDEIQIRVPEAVVREWANTDLVGIEGTTPVGGGETLQLIIEKDFQCMHKGEEGKDPDAYPNPMAAQTAD